MRGAIIAAAVLALVLLGGLAAAAPIPVGPDFRISTVGADGDTTRGATDTTIAYNSVANEYLVVWQADATGDDEFEIFGQRVSAAGTELGSDFQISNVPGGGTRDALDPAVAYNSVANEYLVAWWGDGLATDEEFEVFGQRVSAAGAQIPDTTDFQISNVTAVDANRDSFEPHVAYNSAANDYLVVWFGDALASDNVYEVFGQRISAAGMELDSDFRISNVGSDTDPQREAFTARASYNSAANEYLVTWEDDGFLANEAFEVFGQRVSRIGTELGSDFRISNTTDVGTDHFANVPAATYNSAANEYLVAWSGDGLATDDELEIFGQRVSTAGAELGADFRISNVGSDGDAARDARLPAVAYGSAPNEYLVTWQGDGLATDDEHEIFGQRVSPNGAELGADFRISNVGSDGDAARDAIDPAAAVAYNSAANEYLVGWHGDGLATDDEFEIFGHRLAEPAAPPAAAGTCAGKTATKTGTSGKDMIKGTRKRDVIAALGGRDTVRSLAGNDLVCGGGGKDKLVGATGKDTLRGEAGADTLKGGKGRDKLKGGKGADVLKGGPGKDSLAGGPGRDQQVQ